MLALLIMIFSSLLDLIQKFSSAFLVRVLSIAMSSFCRVFTAHSFNFIGKLMLLRSSRSSLRVFRHGLCFFVSSLFSSGLMKTGASSVLKCFNLCADFSIRFLLMSETVFTNRGRFFLRTGSYFQACNLNQDISCRAFGLETKLLFI